MNLEGSFLRDHEAYLGSYPNISFHNPRDHYSTATVRHRDPLRIYPYEMSQVRCHKVTKLAHYFTLM